MTVFRRSDFGFNGAYFTSDTNYTCLMEQGDILQAGIFTDLLLPDCIDGIKFSMNLKLNFFRCYELSLIPAGRD